jgi:hypothetical protein
MKQYHHNSYRVRIVLAGVLLTLLIGMPGAFVGAAEVLFVPDDYPTIQEAVDAANPNGGDTISVAPGEYAGAVILKSVTIIGSGNETKITSGTWLYDEDAFDIGYVNETEIRNLMIEGDDLLWGFWLYMAHNVTIANVTVNNPYLGIEAIFSDGLTISDSTFNNSYRAIDIRNGSDCEVMHNRAFGLKAKPKTWGLVSHALGIFLSDTNDCVVAHNSVRHIGDAVGGYDEESYVGIALASLGLPTEGNNFHHNRVEVSINWDEAPPSEIESSYAHVVIDYGVDWYGLPISIKNNKLMHNNYQGSDQGVLYYPPEVADYNFAKFNLFDE